MGLDSALSRDSEFHEFERQELITGEPRYIEDEIRNTYLSSILSAVAALVGLIALILVWVLYARQRVGTFITHGIVMIIIVVFAIICIFWALRANRALKVGRQPSSFFTLLIFLLALTAAGYCLVMSMWLILYRAIHHDYLIGVYVANKQDERLPDGKSYNDAWVQDRRLLYWVCTFTLVTALCLGFVAHSAANAVWNKYQLMRYALYFTLAWMTLAAWIILYWTSEAYDREGFLSNNDAFYAIPALKTLAIVALVVAFLNLIINVIKSKIGYFIFGILMAGLFFVLVATDAGLWRQVRREQLQEVNDNANVNCQITQYSIHEHDLNDWCDYLGGKYLAPGQTCGKENLVTRWETGNNEIRSLNPACCLYSKHVNIRPFMFLAFWGMVLFLSTGLSMAINLYLADTTEYLSNANRALGIGDYLGIATIVLLNIVWGIYFIARNGPGKDQVYTRSQYINSYNDPLNNIVPGWPIVPAGLLNQTNPDLISQPVTSSICFPYNTSSLPFPTFQTNGTSCTDPSACTIRLAVSMLNNATFLVGNVGTANRAFSDNRFVFFPQCAQVMSDFLMFYGTQDQIRQVLTNLQICPASVSTVPIIQVYTDQVPTNSIANSGLLANETGLNTNAAANQNTALCGAGFSNSSCSATAVCRFRDVLSQQLVARTLKGRFYYITNGQKRYDVPNTIGFVASDVSGPVGGESLLFNDGIFSIAGVPLYLSGPYRLRLNITDSSNTFLPNVQDVLIDPRFGTDQISAGEIRLLTKDGNVCLPFFNTTCLQSQPTSRGRINVIVQNGGATVASTSSPRMPGADVRVLQYHVLTGNNVAQSTTDNNGFANFNNLVYDAYSIIASKTGFNPSVQFVDLQSPVLNPGAFTLIPSLTDYDAKVTADMVTPATDFDLIVQMRNLNNNDCEVSPYNKYCPYSYHVNDITSGPGQESVIIKKFAVATYNAYVRQSPPYNPVCDSNNFVRANAYHLMSKVGFNWMHMQGSQQVRIAPGIINALTLFGGNTAGLSFEELLLRSLVTSPLVESDAEAQRNKTVIRVNGTALAPGQRFNRTSFFLESDRNQTAANVSVPTVNNSLNQTPTAPETFSSCTNPPPGAINCLNGSTIAVIPPATINVTVTNYSLNNSHLVSNLSITSNVTNYSTNQTIMYQTSVVNNTLNTTDNTTVNGTYNNTTILDPSGQGLNSSNISSRNFTNYTNGSNATAFLSNYSVFYPNGTNASNLSSANSTSNPNGSNSSHNFSYFVMYFPNGSVEYNNSSGNASELTNGSNISLFAASYNFRDPNGTNVSYYSSFENLSNVSESNITVHNSSNLTLNGTFNSANIAVVIGVDLGILNMSNQTNFSNLTNNTSNGSNLTENGTNGTNETNTSGNDTMIPTNDTTPMNITNLNLVGNSTEGAILLRGNLSVVNNSTNVTSLTANNSTSVFMSVIGNFTNGLSVNLTLLNSSSSANNATTVNYSIYNESVTNYSTYHIEIKNGNWTANNSSGENISEYNYTVNISYFNNRTIYYSEVNRSGNFSNVSSNNDSNVSSNQSANRSNYSNVDIISNFTSVSGVYFNISSNNSSRIESFNANNSSNGNNSLLYQEIFNGSSVLNFSENYTTEFGNFNWCNVSDNSTYQEWSNNTSTYFSQLEQFCDFGNDTQFNKTNISYFENDSSSGLPVLRNNSNITLTYYYPNGSIEIFQLIPDGSANNNTNTTAGRRRMLSEFVHFQANTSNNTSNGTNGTNGTNTTSPPVVVNATATGNFLWISCFTGFGRASVININSLQDVQPTLDNCVARINAERPNYTVQRLNDAVRNYRP